MEGGGQGKIAELVKFDSLILLKLTQLCQDSETTAIGHLLGLDLGKVVEVTDCYPLPLRPGDKYASIEQYNNKMHEVLGGLGLDNKTVGWFQRSDYGDFIDAASVENQYEMQRENRNSIMLTYDPVQEATGGFPLKAYRLTEAFMAFYASQEHTFVQARKYDLRSGGVFESIALEVQHSSITEAFLAQFAPEDAAGVFKSSVGMGFLEKELSSLTECVEELSDKQQKTHTYVRSLQKQKAQQKLNEQKIVEENRQRKMRGQPLINIYEGSGQLYRAIPPPNRLESLLAEQQAAVFCEELDLYAEEAAARLRLLKAFQSEA